VRGAKRPAPLRGRSCDADSRSDGRLYANQMVDHPYTRYGITDDVRSQIVPTLIRQKR